MARRKAFRIYGDVPELLAVPPAVRQAAMPEIVAEGAAVAKREAPKGRGAGSPKSIVNRITGASERAAAIGHIRSRAPHSHLIEFGTGAHSLASGFGRRSKKKTGRVEKIMGNANILRRGPRMGPTNVMLHPGSRANPFMERTDAQLPAIANRALQHVGEQALARCIRHGVEL